MTIRVLLADDQQLVRVGFRMILDAQPDIEVIGEAADGVDAVSTASRDLPDMVLMDIRMPNLDGIEATRRILGGKAAPVTKVVILTTYDLDEYVFDALRAGASGFLLKDTPADQLVAGVRQAHAGDALLAPSITRRLIEEFTADRPAKPPADLHLLSPREVEVLGLVARGMSNREIADHLIVGETTIKTHVARTLAKLGLRDRVQAVVYAYETGLITAGSNLPLPPS